jgi:transposase
MQLGEEGGVMDQVIIGVDPHKLSVTIEARDRREVLRATGRFGTDTAGYRQLLQAARQWPQRVWAVEGANGIGRPVAQRLLADGERVLDVPAKLAARHPTAVGCQAAAGSLLSARCAQAMVSS